MQMARLMSVATLAFAILGSGCSTAPKSEADRNDLSAHAAKIVPQAEREDASLKAILDTASGYAVFPSVGKGAVGVGGAYGRGILYEHGKPTGYCDLSQATIGLQLGGQSYTEIIAFENDKSLGHFKEGKLAFDAQATAVAIKSGAGANAKYSNGVAVFTMNESGLMYEASLGGQSFSYQSF